MSFWSRKFDVFRKHILFWPQITPNIIDIGKQLKNLMHMKLETFFLSKNIIRSCKWKKEWFFTTNLGGSSQCSRVDSATGGQKKPSLTLHLQYTKPRFLAHGETLFLQSLHKLEWAKDQVGSFYVTLWERASVLASFSFNLIWIMHSMSDTLHQTNTLFMFPDEAI